jgi:hypothetical protein
MISNLEKYKKDLQKLITRGDGLLNALQYDCFQEDFVAQLEKAFKNKRSKKKLISEFVKSLPNFNIDYQKWYSESLVLIKQLLPDRVDDFIGLYKKPKTKRKDITYENYVIEDALIGLEVSRTDFMEGKKILADKKAAIPKFQQQLNILKSIKSRFESSLFDIRQLVQADLFDSELEVAKELNKKGFTRGAGAVAGVILEGHLLQVCDNHKIVVKKKNPTINDLAQLLKDNDVIDTPDWRKIQHLADLRNLCDHKKKKDPTSEQINELIEGVSKTIKTLF